MDRRIAMLAVLAAAAVGVVGCDGNAVGSPPTLSPTVSTEPSPTPTTTPINPADAAAAEAGLGYRRFIASVDATAASGGRNFQGLSKVATGSMLGAELNQAATFRSRKWRGVGKQQVVWTKPKKIGPPSGKGVIGEVTIHACLDTSRATAVDESGKSVKAPGTPTRWLDEMQMRMIDGVWKAERALSRKGAKC